METDHYSTGTRAIARDGKRWRVVCGSCGACCFGWTFARWGLAFTALCRDSSEPCQACGAA